MTTSTAPRPGRAADPRPPAGARPRAAAAPAPHCRTCCWRPPPPYWPWSWATPWSAWY
ncbi:hypothetical protein [Streptacidiphilus sp. P02-A3a]|uniref:hypothetical protein n=1 Tax=Streptacidiphilus sp. P02-A3a TaxID=2704468 RepID=UPI0015F905D3|nr:hypothetical protein [Streptacidiphilus sp. P02-A3a]QMU70076.1 hypothetical protein GXP74_19430 [Streptacidiphilus sp. P02-A3a]